MAINPQKLQEAKKIYGLSDDQVKQILTGQTENAGVSPPIQFNQQQQPQSQGGFMQRLLQSRALPIAGSVVGGGVGALAGGAPALAGAGAGYVGGDVIRKELSNLLGVPGKQGERSVQSVEETAKGGGTAAVAQGVGQTAGFALKLIKPGIVTNFLAKANDVLAKKGFGDIPNTVLENRFMNEVIPKALRFTEKQGEDVVEAGEKLIKNKVKPTFRFDAEELNFLRKNLNAIGDGAEGMKKALIDGLAKIVREEQIKKAPGTGVTLPLQKAAFDIPHALKAFWPTRMLLMISDAMRGAGGSIGEKIGKFGGGPLVGGLSGGKHE